METIYQRVKNYLIKEPKARERRNGSRAIVNLLLEDYPDFMPLKEKLIGLIHSADSYDRLFRKVQLENEELRGLDYDTKAEMVARKQTELGYEFGYHEITKQLKQI